MVKYYNSQSGLTGGTYLKDPEQTELDHPVVLSLHPNSLPLHRGKQFKQRNRVSKQEVRRECGKSPICGMWRMPAVVSPKVPKVSKSRYDFFSAKDPCMTAWFCDFRIQVCRNPDKSYAMAVIPFEAIETKQEGQVETLVATLKTQNEQIQAQNDRLIE